MSVKKNTAGEDNKGHDYHNPYGDQAGPEDVPSSVEMKQPHQMPLKERQNGMILNGTS